MAAGSSTSTYASAFELAAAGRRAEALVAARSALSERIGDERLLALIDELEATPEPLPDTGEWSVGTVVHDRWEVFGSAAGGMGRVHFVRDRAWGGTTLAVKTLHAPAGLSREQRELAATLFLREARVWLDLGGHPNIVSGFYTLELDGALRFFMEYIAGRTLEAVAGAGRMALADVLDLAIQLANGMTYVHARGVVHRDLTPRNCLVGDDGTLRVTDFGLGAAPGQGDGDVAVGMGTQPYMAPEQWRSLAAAGPPADVYTFGVVVYQLLAGERPFDATPGCYARYGTRLPPTLAKLVAGEPPPGVVYRLFHEQVEPLPLTGVPAALDALVRACLAKAPVARPTFEAVRERLLAIAAPYARPLATGLEPIESGENNRALSYHAMGATADAMKILDAWLARHPTALYPWVNRRSLELAAGTTTRAEVRARFHRELRGPHAASIAADPQLRAFDRRLAHAIVEPHDVVRWLAFSRDGTTLLARGDSARAWELDAVTGEVRADIGPVGEPALETFPAAIDGTPDLAVLAWRDGTLFVVRGDEAVPIGVHDGGVRTVALDLANGRALSGGLDGTLRAWALTGGELGSARSCAAHAIHVAGDGASVVVELADRYELCDAQLAVLRTLAREPVVDVGAAWSDGRWWIATPRAIEAFERGGHRQIPTGERVVRVAARAGRVVAQRYTGGIDVYDAATLRPSTRIVVDGRFGGFALGPHARLCIWREDAPCVVRNLATGRETRIEDRREVVTCAAWAPDGDTLAIAGRDRRVRLWSLGGEAPSAWPLAVERGVAASELLASTASRDRLIAELDGGRDDAAAALDALRASTPHLSRDLAIVSAVARAGVARGRRDGVSAVWQLGAGTLPPERRSVPALDAVLARSVPHPLTVTAAGKIGRLVYTAGWDHRLVLWDGRVAIAEMLHPAKVVAAGASPDGALIATAAEDRAVRLWRVHDARLLATLDGLEGPASAVSFRSDGYRLVAWRTDGVVVEWAIDSAWRFGGPPVLPVARREVRARDRESAALVARGGQLLAGGDRAGAMRCYAEAISLQPGNAVAMRSARDLAERASDWTRVSELLELEASFSASAEERVAMRVEVARIHEEQRRDPERARVIYERLLDDDPTNTFALHKVIAHAVALEEWERADELLDRLARRSGSLPTQERHALFRTRGAVKRALGKPTDAADALVTALELAPDSAETLADFLQLQKEAPTAWDYETTLRLLRGAAPPKVTIQDRGELSYVALAGALGEIEQHPAISGDAIVDLSGVTAFDDVGRRSWRVWLARLPGRVTLVECSVAFCDALRADPALAGQATVKSFYAGWRCETCGTDVDMLHEGSDVTDALLEAPMCEECDYRWPMTQRYQ